jgi:hypothetical protein
MSQTFRRFERPRRRLLGRLVPMGVTLAALATLLTFGGSSSTEFRPTADLGQFNPGNIISNEVFFFGNALSASEIQTFLDVRGASCVTGNDGTPCVRVYRQDTGNRSADAYCGGYIGGAQESAATIIAKVASSCNVSPKVLLVMLEKERGLIRASGSSLTSGDYRIAMGYGCPDTAACDTAYYGFQNQVYMAAWQMQKYAKNAGNYAYRAGHTVNIQWHPNAACGSAPVYIENQATAGLYNYTPYQPNGAALGRGGTTECSAYGNRNFWVYFTDWFVSTQSDAIAKASPRGVVDSLVLTSTGFTAGGWAFDPDATNSPVTVRATVNGNVVSSVTADVSRPDVAGAFGVGANHGFALSGLLGHGTHQVCLVADNLSGQGVRVQLGCRSMNFTDRAPVMSVDTFAEQANGSVLISGWVFDPDGNTPQVHVYANGVGRAVTPDVARPDVQALYGSAAGPTSGFSITLGPLAGKQDVCAFAVDGVAPGNNWLSGCRNYTYKSPMGSVDSFAETPTGAIKVSGWAFDPSLPTTATQVHVYVNGRGYAIDANTTREDVGRFYPGTGSSHGFEATIPASAGSNQVCVFGINLGMQGTNPVLGCRTMNLQYTAPTGVVDYVSSAGDGRVRVGGWVFDGSVPTAPVDVHYYVDGRYYGPATAANRRDDIAAAFPGAGALHGFTSTLDVGPGSHQVCTFAINLGVAGTNPLLGCTTLVVADRAPMGSVDSITRSSPTEARVSGWTFDPDAVTQTVSVRVTVDGVDAGTFPANTVRNDVAAAFPGVGPNHGFGIVVPAAAGQREVCVSAVSTGIGSTPTVLRCAQITATP